MTHKYEPKDNTCIADKHFDNKQKSDKRLLPKTYRNKQTNGMPNTRKLKAEQREFILTCFACRYPIWQIRQEWGVKFDDPCPHYDTLAYYSKKTDAIALLREELIADIRSSPLRFINKFERIKILESFVIKEIRRGRCEQAAKYLKQIAEELNDLRLNIQVDGNITSTAATINDIEKLQQEIADIISLK